MSPIVTEKDYYIHYYEVDYKKKCLITSLMNYFQDIAIFQSEKAGIGIDYLRDNNIAWVLHKWDIVIKRYPSYGDIIKVKTVPYSFNKFYAYRKFDVSDDMGRIMASASTEWLLINIVSKRPVRIGEAMYTAYNIHKDSQVSIDIEGIQAPASIDVEKEFYVRYSDIDTNKHVNNVKYVDWSIETIPLEIVLNKTLSRLKVEYKKETAYGETVKVRTQIIKEEEGCITCLHGIYNMEDKELCLVSTKWENNM